jgi:hypothetical protein
MRFALIVAAIATVLIVALPTSSANLPGVARFRETQINHKTIGDGAGSIEVWRTRVWLLKKLVPIGTGVLACIHADNHTDIRECTGTYILPRGRLQVSGEIITRAAFQLTVVGGTGVYTAAGGVGIFAGLPNPAAVTFFLQP